MSRLAFEIGCEEIPARYIAGAVKSMSQLATEMFHQLRIEADGIQVHATPRRLILTVETLAERQQDEVQWVRGPAKERAYTADGQPTAAAQGFARSQQVAVDDLIVRDTPQGEYVFARRVLEGRPVVEILPQALSELITRIEFPQSMRWGNGTVRFIRPIRWLLALLDDKVLPVKLGELEADRYTRGHRTLAPGPHRVARASDLLPVLEKSYVIPKITDRQALISEQINKVAQSLGGEPVLDPEFLAEVTNLVEWPTAFAGSFAPEYLKLPEELLVLTMQTHQRYFPVKSADGKLLPHFIGVRNGGTDGLDQVRAGNEKVLSARLADASFFYTEDKKKPLAEYVPQLAQVTFLGELGSLLDKTNRLVALVNWLVDSLSISDPEIRSAVRRAAELAKADHVTRVVYELPELEGIMGREYALASGEPEAVATALYEQYLPRPGSDEIPNSIAGMLLAIADRLDTLAGSFLAGLEPTGSQDPYGLRRHATALLHLCRHAGPKLNLTDAFSFALAGYKSLTGKTSAESNQDESDNPLPRLAAFCRSRLAAQMREAGYRGDLVEAILSAGWDSIPEVWARLVAGNRLLESPTFDDVYTAFRRPYQLVRNHMDTDVNPDLFQEEAEKALYTSLTNIQEEAKTMLEQQRYDEFFQLVAGLRQPVDSFFDNVMVMTDDPALRRNRLSLLRNIVNLLQTPLHFARLSV